MSWDALWSIDTQVMDLTQPGFLALGSGIFLMVMLGAALHDGGYGERFDPVASFMEKSNFVLWFFIIIVVGLVGICSYHSVKADRDQLIATMRSSDVATVQGVVHIHFIQPASGHAMGDLVEVEGIQFEVSQYGPQRYYHTSLRHGGILSEGRRVRITFIRSTESERNSFGDGKILKIEDWT
jgi:hypothetical protein